MIVIEQTHWPLVVVGALPEAEGDHDVPPTNPEPLWGSEDLRLAVVIRGEHATACVAQAEVFAWLSAHRMRLLRCVSRVAWIFEDEAMRRSAERWLTLVGDRVFRADTMTFRSAGAAIAWLTCDGLASGRYR
jgi:hypothetical protein